jgi:hypothetical protein
MLKAIFKASVSRGQPTANARRNADIASARLWLAEGFPVADILTMLEVRRRFEFSPHVTCAYAVEILMAAKAEINHTNHLQITHRKEQFHAVA